MDSTLMNWTIGNRVVTPRGEVGVIEELEDDMAKVRLMTPNNEPSVLSSWCFPRDLIDGSNVLPQPMSKEWKAKSALFCQAVTNALKIELKSPAPSNTDSTG